MNDYDTRDVLMLRVMPMRNHRLPPPQRANPDDSGLDLRLDLSLPVTELFPRGMMHFGTTVRRDRDRDEHAIEMHPHAVCAVRTGYAIELKPGYEAQVRGRSGLAFKHGVTVGHLGTIDAGYRGEIIVSLHNIGNGFVTLNHGDRIAQLVIHAIPRRVMVETVNALAETPRGERGFGSTGR